jgi:AmmeMemoRadiSam system protein A
MSSADPGPGRAADVSLRGVARSAIEHGLCWHSPLELDPMRFPPELREPGASFVTLRRQGSLRGCTGSLEATRPLVCDVARNAHRSAFGDPRFAALTEPELEHLEIHVSLLSPLEPLPADSERELLERLRPGVDGLVLREGSHNATFLPAVWESLPEPRDFLEHLREKAGLPHGHWSESLRFERYTTADAD